MRAVAAALLILLAACARPLSQAEEKFASDLFGPSLDTKNVKIAQGIGLFPPYNTVPASLTVMRGTEKACVRTPQPRGAQPPQAPLKPGAAGRMLGGPALRSEVSIVFQPCPERACAHSFPPSPA